MAWQDTIDAVSSGVTAVGIVVGGWWAYKRFGIEAPHWTRADVQVCAELVTWPDNGDVLRVDLAVSAVGSARLKVVRNEDRGPSVVVYRFTTEMRDTSSQLDEWANRVATQRVLPQGQDIIEAGETILASHLLPLGPRLAGTLAYRVEFTFGLATTVSSETLRGWPVITSFTACKATPRPSEARPTTELVRTQA